MGTSTIVYVSIPDNASSTCGSLGLPTLPTGYTYNCVTTQNLRNTDGTGWIPVNFQRISSNSPISQLPIDPQNTTSTKYYTYVAGGSWQLAVNMESQKYIVQSAATNDYDPGLYVTGNNNGIAPFVGGLVGWWKFDDGNNTTTSDASGNNNFGTWNGTSTTRYGVGKSGSSGMFVRESRDYLSTFANMSKAKNTISAWIKIGSSSTNTRGQQIFYSYPTTHYPSFIILEKSGQLYTYNAERNGVYDVGMNLGCPYSANYSCVGAISASQWVHVVVSHSGSSEIVYVNGVQTASRAYSGTGGITGQFRMGWAFWSYQDYFTGELDDVRLYNRAFSAAEVQALYNATK